MKWLLFALGMWLPCVVCASSLNHPLIKDFPSSKLFNEEVKTFDKVSLVAGEIDYLQGGDEGYLASASLDIEGETHSYIHDYPKSFSSLHLYQEMLHRLDKNKFEIIYHCAEEDCGDLTGWQLYLSDKLSGSENSQYYVLAKQNGIEGHSWFVQFYAINLDGESRSYFRIINAKQRPVLTIAFNKDLLRLSSADSGLATLENLPGILFDVDSAVLAEAAQSYLHKIKREITSKGITQVVIAGHTDSTGSRSYNSDLSMRRALSVADKLKQYPELSGVNFSVQAYGESLPVADNSTAAGRGKNRRVSVSYRPEQAGRAK